MRLTRLDDRTADRLLAGAVTSEDAPPGYAGVARFLQAARPRPAAGELAREAATVATMTAALLAHTASVSQSRRKHMISKILTAKAAAAAAAVLLSAGTAGAATGTLPGAAQGVASDMLAKVHISVPGPNGHSNGHSDTRGTSADHPAEDTTSADQPGDEASTAPGGPDGHADFGLCTAKAAMAEHSQATVFPSDATCAAVTHPGKPSDPGSQGDAHKPSDPGSQGHANKPSDPGSQAGTNKPSDPGSDGDAHKPSTPAGPPASTPASDTAPVSTPNGGSAATSDSGDGAAPGTATASDHDGGASSTGSTASSSGSGNTSDRSRP
jgi:hypothetical protein